VVGATGTVPPAVPSLFHSRAPELKYSTLPTWVISPGERFAITSIVPPGVPSLFHSAPLTAMNTVCPTPAAIAAGTTVTEPITLLMSLTRLVLSSRRGSSDSIA
jgi:hypothetical protein